jgi:hypothetical protein
MGSNGLCSSWARMSLFVRRYHAQYGKLTLIVRLSINEALLDNRMESLSVLCPIRCQRQAFGMYTSYDFRLLVCLFSVIALVGQILTGKGYRSVILPYVHLSPHATDMHDIVAAYIVWRSDGGRGRGQYRGSWTSCLNPLPSRVGGGYIGRLTN